MLKMKEILVRSDHNLTRAGGSRPKIDMELSLIRHNVTIGCMRAFLKGFRILALLEFLLVAHTMYEE